MSILEKDSLLQLSLDAQVMWGVMRHCWYEDAWARNSELWLKGQYLGEQTLALFPSALEVMPAFRRSSSFVFPGGTSMVSEDYETHPFF